MPRIPLELLRELAKDFKEGFDLPHVFLAGSQSPKYPHEPKEDSDIDFVAFPIDFKRRRNHYMKLNKRYRLKSGHPQLDGKRVCLGIFDPKDPKLNEKTIKGHSVEYWRKYNVRLV